MAGTPEANLLPAYGSSTGLEEACPPGELAATNPEIRKPLTWRSPGRPTGFPSGR